MLVGTGCQNFRYPNMITAVTQIFCPIRSRTNAQDLKTYPLLQLHFFFYSQNQKHTLKKQQKNNNRMKTATGKKVSLSLFYGTMQNTSGDAWTVLIILREYLPYLNILWTYTLWDKQILIHTLNSLLILFYS